MRVDEAVAFIKQHERNGWVNLNIKTARSGNHYVELDTYEAQAEQSPKLNAAAPKAKPKAAPQETEELPF
jgi:hypothetical protein